MQTRSEAALGPVVPASHRLPSVTVPTGNPVPPRHPSRDAFPPLLARSGRIGPRLAARRFILGLLGPVAAGKSFVARRIAALAPGEVIDADALAHEALDAAARDGRLAAALGPSAVGPDGRADRAALGVRVAADPQVLRTLEGLTHPIVQARILEAVARHRSGEGPAVLVLDVPLLLEAGLDRACDELWLVEADEAVRRERARRRGLSAEELTRWERAQVAGETRRARARRVIRNDVTPDALDRQVQAALAAPTAA